MKQKVVTYQKQKVQKIAKKTFKRLLGSTLEKKMFDVFANNSGPVDYSGAVLPLADIPQGDDIVNKIGRKINLVKLEFKLAIKAPNWVAGDYAQFRLIIFQDMQNTGIDPVPTDVIEVTGSAAGMLSPTDRQWVQSKRFKIIYDKTRNINYNDKLVNLFHFKKSKGLRPIEYISSATTANGKGMLYFLVISDQPPSVGRAINYDYYSRVTFTDA